MCSQLLSFSTQTQNDFVVICNVAKILELVVPLMEHPSETFLATIEEDLMKLIIKYGMLVGDHKMLCCLLIQKCLAALVPQSQ